MSLERESNQPERIERKEPAALRYRDRVYRGQGHWDARDKLMQEFPDARTKEIEFGFVTTKGRFVTKEEAAEIARTAEQLKKPAQENPTYYQLFSDDLKKKS
jgi:hypothetical protein